MGANGAGKSTLAKIAAGVIQPDDGRILVSGREIRLASPHDARRAGIVAVHQSTDQLGVPGLTVGENLAARPISAAAARECSSRDAGSPRERKRGRRADRILTLPLDQDFGALGPAHRQLVAIARAVAAERLGAYSRRADREPVGCGSRATFRGRRSPRAARGVGVLYISHRLGDIRRLADRIVVLRNGRRVADQAKPFDFAAAVRAMIGRNLGDVRRAVRSCSGARRLILAHDRRPADSRRAKLRPCRSCGRSRRGYRRCSARARAGCCARCSGSTRSSAARIALDGAPWRPTRTCRRDRARRLHGRRRPMALVAVACCHARRRHRRHDRPSPSPIMVSRGSRRDERERKQRADDFIRKLGVRCRGAARHARSPLRRQSAEGRDWPLAVRAVPPAAA